MSTLVAAVAAHGLRTDGHRWPTEPLDDAAWSAFLGEVQHQRLAGLLVAAVLDGTMPVTTAQRSAAESAHFAAVCAALLLEAATLRTIGILEEAGVPVRLLKGPAVAHLDYPDPSLRQFGDIDLLVPADAFDAGVAALVAARHHRRYPQPRPGFDRRFSKGTSFLTPDDLEIDYHRVFVMGPFGLRLDARDLWAGKTTLQLGGRSLGALDDECRFLHACFHTALGNKIPRLVPQRDVAQMLENDRLDHERVRALAESWGATPVVASALRSTWTNLRPAERPSALDWAWDYAPSRRDAFELGVYSDPDGGYAGKSLAALFAIPQLRDKLAFARALAWPDHDYVVDRYSGAGVRWKRGVAAARRLVVR